MDIDSARKYHGGEWLASSSKFRGPIEEVIKYIHRLE